MVWVKKKIKRSIKGLNFFQLTGVTVVSDKSRHTTIACIFRPTLQRVKIKVMGMDTNKLTSLRPLYM